MTATRMSFTPEEDARFRICVDRAKQAAVAAFDVRPDELAAATRSTARIAFARQTAMYLCHVVFGLSLSEIGAAFARDRTTVSHACHLVEDRRDDPHFDRLLDRLEADLCDDGSDGRRGPPTPTFACSRVRMRAAARRGARPLAADAKELMK